MRRTALLLVLAAALTAVASGEAALQPLQRRVGDVTVPRVLRGSLRIPPGHASGRVRVIVTLELPPLAAAYGDGVAYRLGQRKLDVGSGSARAYLARVDAAQRRAIAALRRAIPQAKVSWRYRIVLDGFTVSLPVRLLPTLVRLGSVAKVYPSLRYTLSLNRSPAVIGATALRAATGTDGRGVKIGVVDDGIDETNPFFNPAGFSYPAGFPKGQTTFTTPKVIVARSFPGPGTGERAKLPLDRRSSFHGTHVAGIAAGDAGTTAPEGPDHPTVTGLSGVAPRAWLGSYRVFSPIGFIGLVSAEAPEIAKAFEQAVADGMDVINFSGGGPEIDPASDVLIEAVRNVATAGVVPVISAGNDRDDFGLGTVGSPGTAPDAVTVAAVSNSHFFGRELTVVSPALAGASRFPFAPARNGVPGSWADGDQALVDVGAIAGTDGKPVEQHLCGPSPNPNAAQSTLPPGSLSGKIALVSRGSCTFTSKSRRVQAAGGIGMIVVDNRPGEPNPIPIDLAVPSGMISDLDGARLRDAMAKAGAPARIRVAREQHEIETDRSGVPTSFSSAGPTAFGHQQKPDVSAPGGQILSSTLSEVVGEPFAVFDGTSMSAPHIAGAAALLVQRHSGWSPAQVKSALMSTAGPAFADTSRTAEAPVLLEGAGLASLTAADDPKIFTAPQSLSFRDLNVAAGAQSRQLLVTVSDAGGGAGTWQIELRPQSASPGAALDLPPAVTLAPGGSATLSIVARAPADASAGDDYGFVVLRQGDVTRRIPYSFFVTRPRLAGVPLLRLKAAQTGDTRRGENRASVYRWPTAPFGLAPSFFGPPVNEAGAERVYVTDLKRKAVNIGVAVITESSGSLIEPWLLGSLDENAVQGYAGTPVNVNNSMFDYRLDVGAAGANFPQPGRYYVAVDSGRDPFTGRPFAGRYTLRSWVDDLKPPRASLITTRVAAGRPTIALRAVDAKSGVDPFSIAVGYGTSLVAAAVYDPKTGVALIPLPAAAPQLKAGTAKVLLIASDYQETKNVDQIGPNPLPNTAFVQKKLTVVRGPTVAWLAPETGACVSGRVQLLVVASDTAQISSVVFYDGERRVARVKKNVAGLYVTTWRTGGVAKGRHTLRAVAADPDGLEASASRAVRVCGT